MISQGMERINQKWQRSSNLKDILKEIQEAETGGIKRQELIKRIQEYSRKKEGKERKLILYIANVEHPKSAMNSGDIIPLADMLSRIGETQNLDLMLHSFGGDGNIAEKIIQMFREHCSEKGEFRVIIPNMAKSAATLVTFGANKIVMGYCSELGPIDPQIQVNIHGATHYVSAQSFIDARNQLVKKTESAIKNDKPSQPYLQQLATLDPAFVNHCERMMNFARDMSKWLATYMLADKQKEAKKLAKVTTEALCMANRFFSHGRMITAHEIEGNPDIHLKIDYLEKDSEHWGLLWELYVRCEVFLRAPDPRTKKVRAKLFHDEEGSITLT